MAELFNSPTSSTGVVITPPSRTQLMEIVRAGAEQALAWMHNALGPEDLGMALHALDRLILAQDAGHTFFGSKPVTITHFKMLNDSHAKERYPDMQEFTTLRTLISKLPIGRSSAFAILKLQDGLYVDQADQAGRASEGYQDVLVINREQLHRTCAIHSDLIAQKLGESFTCRSLIEQIEQRGSFLGALQGSRLLEGLFLGYGLEASRLFEERFRVSQKLFTEQDPLALLAYREYEIELRSKSAPLCTTPVFEGHPYAPHFMVNKFNPNADGLVAGYQRSTEWITALSAEKLAASAAIARLGGWLPSALFDTPPNR